MIIDFVDDALVEIYVGRGACVCTCFHWWGGWEEGALLPILVSPCKVHIKQSNGYFLKIYTIINLGKLVHRYECINMITTNLTVLL